MNDIITTDNMEFLPRESQARFLHSEILKNGADAAEAMFNLASNLKKMRDSGLYTELGYETFEDYAVNAAGLKKTQAYDYIKALESLGEDVFRSSGKLGITKVKALCAFTREQAEEFINENDAEAMTVKELKEKIKKLTGQGEQLSMDLSESISAIDTKDNEIKKLQDEISSLEKYTENLKSRNKELENKPTEVAVREPTEEELNELTKKAVTSATKELKKELAAVKKEKSDSDLKHKEELQKAQKEAAEKAEREIKAKNSEFVKEIDKAKERAAELEKQLKISSSPEITRFSFYFEALQENANKLLETLNKIDDYETAAKLKANMCKYADVLRELFLRKVG